MGSRLPPRLLLASAILSALAAPALALSLGKVRSAVLIGRALDVSIPVTLDANDDAAGLCPEATVLYGDTRVPTERVEWLPADASSKQSLLHIRVATPVDEPVVTIFLKTGCLEKISRRYVLLAELITEVQAPAATGTSSDSNPAAVSAVTIVPAKQQAVPGQVTAIGEKPLATPPAAGGKPAPSPQPKSQVRPVLPALAVKPAAKPASPSRLTLLPSETLAQALTPHLKLSTELVSAVSTDGAARRTAAQVWQAMQQSTPDIIKNGERIQALERDLQAAQKISSAEHTKVATLSSELQAEKTRTMWWLAAGLAALAAVAVGLWWRRRPRGFKYRRDWWRRTDSFSDSDQLDKGFVGATAQVGGSSRHSGHTHSLDVDLDLDTSAFGNLRDPTKSAGESASQFNPKQGGPEFGVSVLPGMSRSVNAEELFDIQQQADFFMTLGQYDQAIGVLRNHIDDKAETSALAYLDLFKIYHTRGMREEYQALRVEFNQVFNAKAPDFDEFTEDHKGLEHYQGALSRIVALWPSAKVLEVIEESIFRKPGSVSDAFGLEAYRELQLLYAVAKDVVERKLVEPVVSSNSRSDASMRFMSTSIQPLSAAIKDSDADLSAFKRSTLSNRNRPIVLDIDLDEYYSSKSGAQPGSPAGSSHSGDDAVPGHTAASAAPEEFPSMDFLASEPLPDLRIVKKPK